LTRAILSTCHQMARKPPVTVIKWLWQNPELRDYNRNQVPRSFVSSTRPHKRISDQGTLR